MAETMEAPTRNDLILDMYAERRPTEEISRAVNRIFGHFVGDSEINAVVHRAKQARDKRAVRKRLKTGRETTSFNDQPFGKTQKRRPPRDPDLKTGTIHHFSPCAVNLMKAGPRQCRFPLNSEASSLMCCGVKIGDGLRGSYCEAHRKKCYGVES